MSPCRQTCRRVPATPISKLNNLSTFDSTISLGVDVLACFFIFRRHQGSLYNMKNITFSNRQEKINSIVSKTKKILKKFPYNKYGNIRDRGLSKLDRLDDEEGLTIAFVGQYSAGKSTIISTLTGLDDIEIGQGVVTDEPSVYEWKEGVRIVDTPGIYADRPKHDEMSLRYMDEADLLVYVATVNGLDKIIGENFRELAIEQGRAGKMMLTLNKRATEPGSNVTGWKESLRPVVKPLDFDDLRLTIIDAEEYLEAQEDEEFGAELQKLSHFEEFVDELNAFVEERGLHGRLLSQLNVVETTIDDTLKQVGATSEDVRLIQEHLRRNAVAVRESRGKIEQKIEATARELETSVLQKGRELAREIDADTNQDDLKDENRLTVKEIKSEARELNRELENFVVDEVNNLQDELETLAQSDLAEAIQVRLNSSDPDLESNEPAEEVSPPDSAGETLRGAGDFLRARSFSDASQAGLKAVSGSDVHSVVKNVGHWVGHKFKPWQAVKIADKIGKAGKALGALGALLGPALDLWNEWQAQKREKQLQEARDSVRDQYRRFAEGMAEEYEEVKEKVFGELHDPELEAIREESDALANIQEQKDDRLEELNRLRDRAQDLISQLQP